MNLLFIILVLARALSNPLTGAMVSLDWDQSENHSPAPSTSAEPLTANDIYDRTRAVVSARTTPAFITLHEDQTLSRKGRIYASHDDLIIRTSDGEANETTVPDSPRDKVDTRPQVTTGGFTPLTVFGLVKRKPGEKPSIYEVASTPEPEPTPAQQGALTVIGSVKTVARDYAATFVGTETIDGTSVYHLAMRPRFDPKHHPIRDLYVDTTTFDPRRIEIEYYASQGPITSRPTITFDYTPVEGNWVIAHASTYIVARLGPLAYGGTLDYRASNHHFPTSEPDYLFDKKQLAAYLKAQSEKSPEQSP
jgi:hypothetical protein